MGRRFGMSSRAGNRGAAVNAARALAAGREAERAVDALVGRLRSAAPSTVDRLLGSAGVDLPVRDALRREAAPGCEHVVGFYDDDDELAGSVSSFLVPAIQVGAPVVVIATPAHRAQILDALAGEGVDVERTQRAGSLRCLDAAATMATFMVDGHPDPVRFGSSVGSVLAEAAHGGRHVWAYGEMVALLWDRGDVQGAIELEGLWNDLARSQPHSLLCGYPAAILDDGGRSGSIRSMCACHSSLDGGPAAMGPPLR